MTVQMKAREEGKRRDIYKMQPTRKHESMEQFLASLEDLSEAVSVTNCDREPIHRPEAIQPHGVMFVLSEPDLKIVRVSENVAAIVAIAPEALLDRELAAFVDPDSVASIRGCLDRNFEDANPLEIGFIDAADGRLDSSGPRQIFTGIVHRAPSGEVVLEIEARGRDTGDFFRFHNTVKASLRAFRAAATLQELCDRIAAEIARIAQFDRVMVYQFAPNGDGQVRAEVKRDDLESFLGLHYPSRDIPRQSRYLYVQNWLRSVPTVFYEPVPLLTAPSLGESERPPLDMTFSMLRSVSPIHLEYLQNMGVTATMTISLIRDGELWGLIACHHNTPKLVPYDLRTVCEFLGQSMSIEIANKETSDRLDRYQHQRDIKRYLLDRLSGARDFLAVLGAETDRLLQLVGASGGLVIDGNRRLRFGETPDEAASIDLQQWLVRRFQGDSFQTDHLSSLYPAAAEYAEVASGLLAIAISSTPPRYLLWFRPEVRQTIVWAGQPDKIAAADADGEAPLRPRQSFAAWEEAVRGTSEPWSREEVIKAIELRKAIVDVVLQQAFETVSQQADTLGQLNQDLVRSNAELDSFVYIASHDLKEPLRGIHNYATFLLEDYSTILDEEGISKLETLVQLSTRMDRLVASLMEFSHIDNQYLQMQPIDLNQMLAEIRELLEMSSRWPTAEIYIPEPLPLVSGEKSLINEVFVNLISNAFKYNTQERPWVELGVCGASELEIFGDDPIGDRVALYVRDNGIGIRKRNIDSVFRVFKRLHAPSKFGGGSGAGLTIVRKIVERHGGTVRVASTYREGSTFVLTLPTLDREP